MTNLINKSETEYLEAKVNCYLEPMLIEMLEQTPSDSLGFMKKWLSVRGEGIKDEMLSQEVGYQESQFRKGRDIELPMPAMMEAINHHEESASPKKSYNEISANSGFATSKFNV
jgi:hypothetical protein